MCCEVSLPVVYWDQRKLTEILIVEKIKKLDDMLVYTQKLKADHEERELLHGSRGSRLANIEHGAVCNICDFWFVSKQLMLILIPT
jgi:hypothetical protein